VLDSDTHGIVGVGGTNLASSGDSISNGVGDSYSLDDNSDPTYGLRISQQGYEANLIDLLNGPAPVGDIHNVFNVANPGDRSNHLADRIASILEQQADADIIPVLIGTNDAGIKNPGPRPSGLGCTGAACDGTYFDYLQQIVDAITTTGKQVYVALVPPRFGPSGQPPFVDPENDPDGRNAEIRDYNQVIQTQLTGHAVGPDFYSYFLDPTAGVNRFFLFSENLHPGGLANQVMAVMWNNALNPTNPQPLPYIVDALCLRLVAGGPCAAPLTYKEDLKEVGDDLFVDEAFTLTSIPSVLDNGRWLSTANSDRNQANADYLSFEVGGSPVTVYVAYDAAATSLPSWLSGAYVDAGATVATDNTAAPVLRLYRASNVTGTVTVGGADATTHGAGSNFVVIVVKP